MNIGVPRYLIVGMAALFSAYHLVLATYSLTQQIPNSAQPIFVAMALYAAASILSLLPWGPTRMPIWMAAFNLAVVIALPLLVTHELDPSKSNGYATWYVAAVGTLMTITSTRRRHTFAWIGAGFLVAQTIFWAGPGALGGIGVVGSVVWVAVAHILSSGMAKATRDAQRFALAEREATDWQAAQEAHVFERQFRLDQTSSMALDMLRQIEESNGRLTEEQRQECLHLEGAIRDEIRGRKLLNDAVRSQVMSARRRGATVNLLDEGGIDDLSDVDLDRVLNRLAAALASTDADKVIARTVPEGSDVAITVVGLRTVGDGSASALGQEALDEDEVDLWLEIPRAAD
jgi:YD repeat-containing protein